MEFVKLIKTSRDELLRKVQNEIVNDNNENVEVAELHIKTFDERRK